MNTFTCPACGEEVPAKARACPHCGSDDETGWSDKTYLDGVDLYNEDDYQDSLRREFGGPAPKRSKTALIIAIIAAVVVICFVLNYVF